MSEKHESEPPDSESGDNGRGEDRTRSRIPGVGVARATVGGAIGGTKAFSAGFFATFRGAKRLTATPSWWPIAVLPVAVAFAVFGGIAWWTTSAISNWARELISGGEDSIFGAVAEWMISLGVIVIWLFVFYFVFSTFVRLVAAPFLAIFSERVYMRVSGCPSPTPPGTRFRRWLLRPIWEAFVFVTIRLVAMLCAAPLLCIPVVGQILFVAVLLPLEGMDLLDLALSARAVRLDRRLGFGLRNKMAAAGLGAGAMLVLLIPVVNVLMLPALVVGAVLLDEQISPDFRDVPDGALPPTPRKALEG